MGSKGWVSPHQLHPTSLCPAMAEALGALTSPSLGTGGNEELRLWRAGQQGREVELYLGG